MRKQQIRTALLQLRFKPMPDAGTLKLEGGALVKAEAYVNEPMCAAFNFNTIVDLGSVTESWSWICQPKKDEHFMAVFTGSNFAAALDLLENLAKLHPILLQASSAGKEGN
ncbi:MAG: hypothetical protein ACJ71W_05905 [Terriglobales bacterium]